MSLSKSEVKIKKKRNYYFTREVQDDIIAYNSTDDVVLKNKLYSRSIHQAFWRLSEAILKTFKFTYMDGMDIEDIIHEGEIHIFNNIHMFDPSRGTAYAYFGTSLKRKFILLSQQNYKKLKENIQPLEVDFESIDKKKYDDNEYEKSEMVTDYFTEAFCQHLEENFSKYFVTRQDVNIAEATIKILRSVDKLDIFDKKSFMVYIRDMVDASETKITEVFKIVKSKYFELIDEFEEYGYLRKRLDKTDIYE